MKFFCLIAFLLFASPLIFAQTTTNYYVSDTGNDANPGTAAQPFRTIQKCVSKFNDTTQVICNCAGTFNEEIAITAGGPSVEKRSKIIAWDTDGDGSLRDETFIIDGQGTRNEAIKAVTGARPDNIEIAWAVFRNYNPDGGCNIDDDGELHFIKMVCWGEGGCADWWIHDNVFEKLGKSCNVESHYIAIQPSNTPRLVVENNRFDSVGGFIMRYVGGTGIKFRNNHVLIQGTGIKAWDDPDSIEITGNVFECDGNGINKPGDTRCAGQAAVSLSNNVTASQVKDNVFLDCVTAINIATDSRYGEKNNGPHLVEGNRVYQSGKVCNRYAPAIEISDGSDTTIYGDSIHVFGVTIRNNVIAWVDSTQISVGTAFSLSAGHPFPFQSDIRIYNNTIRSYGRALLLSLAANSGVPFHYQLNGVDLRNNIFNDIKDEFFTLAGAITSWPDSGRALNWNSDYNLYSGRDRITWGGTRYTLAQWKAAKGEDAHSRVASPLFAADSNRSRPLLKLAATDTVALNKGSALADVMFDFSHLPRPMGGAWEIGAHEFRQKRIYYASDHGSDTNLGTADQPFRTLQRGIDLWNGIDQFELRGAGTFGEELLLHHGGLNADSLNAILPWDTDHDGSLADETFVLDGGDSLHIALRTDTLDSPDYVRIAGMTFRNYASSDCDTTQEVRFLRLKGNAADNLTGWRVEGNSFLNLSTDCRAVEKRGALRATWVDDLLIEGNRFDSIGGFILNKARGRNILFSGNNVRILGQGVQTCDNVDSLRIVHNVFVGNSNETGTDRGVCKEKYAVEIVNGVRGALIGENTIIGCSGGVRFGLNKKGSRNNMGHIVERNIIYMNQDACNSGRPGILIADRGDTAENGAALHIEDVLIRNNVLAYDGPSETGGAGIKLVTGHPWPFVNNFRIYNNTVHGFDQGILAREGEDVDENLYRYHLNGLKVKNNLFSEMAEGQFKFQIGLWRDSLPTGWESDYNVFGGANAFRWEGKKALTAWRRLFRQDMHSTLCASEFAAGDTLYHLSGADRCAPDAGISLSEVLDDIDGESRFYGEAPDIGADEYVGEGLARVVAEENPSDAMASNPEAAILSNLHLYPNPASGKSRLEFFLPESQPVSIRFYDLAGVCADLPEQVLLLESGRHRLEIGVEDLPAGVYLVVVRAGEAEYTGRMVVLHP